jgi:hypothetical protein
MAPTSPPGMIDSMVILLSRVYRKLYNSTVIIPRDNGNSPVSDSNIAPDKKRRADIFNTFPSDILPEGMGLFLALPIRESVALSEYWFRAADPAARRNTPAERYSRFKLMPGPDIKYPVTEENTTASDNLYLIRSAKTDKFFCISLFSCKCFQIVGDCNNFFFFQQLTV